MKIQILRKCEKEDRKREFNPINSKLFAQQSQSDVSDLIL